MNQQKPNSFRTGPDERGRFGDFGGRFVSETLMPLILELEARVRDGQDRRRTSGPRWTTSGSTTSAGRRPLYFAERLTERLGGAKVYFKRDELNHTGAHKINNVLGPDPAGAAHGQDPDHRRDRRRPARRGDRDGLRARSG